MPVEEVRLNILNTDQLEFDTGVGGTRTTNTSGGATYRAAQALRAKLVDMVSGMRQWPADQVVLRDGTLSLQGSSEGALTLEEIAAHAIAETGEPLAGEVHHRAAESDVTSFCAQVAEVEVDTETGEVEVTKFVTAHDVGTVLNPLAHQGQIEGPSCRASAKPSSRRCRLKMAGFQLSAWGTTSCLPRTTCPIS